MICTCAHRHVNAVMSASNEHHQTAVFELQQSFSANSGRHNAAVDQVFPQELKPVDKGRAAWTVLAAGFVFEALFWGLSSYSAFVTVEY